MYIINDFVGKTTSLYFQQLGFMNTMLENWPTSTMADGTVIFNRLYLWTKGGGVNQSAQALRIYPLIGLSVASISRISKKGITSLYYNVNNNAMGTAFETQDIEYYLQNFSPMIYPLHKDVFNPDPVANTNLNPDPYATTYDPISGSIIHTTIDSTEDPLWDNQGWISVLVNYTPSSYQLNPTDADIINAVTNMDSSKITFDYMNVNRCFTAAVMDTSNVLFETQIIVNSRTMTSVTSVIDNNYVISTIKGTTAKYSKNQYLQSATVLVKFRRINSPMAVECASLIASIRDKAHNASNNQFAGILNSIDDLQSAFDVHSSFAYQIYNMINYIDPPNSSPSNFIIASGNPNGYLTQNNTVGIRVDYLSTLKAREFVVRFTQCISIGYDKKKASFWETVAAVFIIIVAIVLIVLSIFFPALAPVAYSLTNVGLILLGAYALEVVLAITFRNAGETGGAQFALSCAQYIGYAEMAVGIAALYEQGINYFAQQSASQEAGSTIVTNTTGQSIMTSASGSLAQPGETYVVSASGAISPAPGGGLSLIVGSLKEAFQVGSATGSVHTSKDTSTLMSFASLLSGTVSSSGVQIDALTMDLGDDVSKIATGIGQESTSLLLNQGMNFLNTGFNFYMNYINPVAKSTQSEQNTINAQNDAIAANAGSDPLGEDFLDQQRLSVNDSYDSIFETTDYIEKSYYLMTQGSVDALMNQYYNASVNQQYV